MGHINRRSFVKTAGIAGLAAASAARIIGGHADGKGNSALYDQFLREAGEGNGNAD